MRPKVEFHTGVADESGFACRLLRKAYHVGARVLVRGPAPLLQRLDRELWTFAEREFIPHLRFSAASGAPAQARRTPIWLVDDAVPPGHPSLLVNLDAEVPAQLQGFERIIEVVGLDAEVVRRGRIRWRAYEACGLRPVHHVAGGGGG